MTLSTRLLTVAAGVLFSAAPILAQSGEAGPGWTMETDCLPPLPYPTVPQSQWDFEGVIFNRNDEGVRAIRSDIGTSYFVATESDSAFPSTGGFSLDGRWFAFPRGSSSINSDGIGDKIFGVDSIEIISTDGLQIRTQVPLSYPAGFGFAPAEAMRSIFWIDDAHFVVPESGNLINATTGEVTDYDVEPAAFYLHDFSPDLSRALFIPYRPDGAEPLRMVDLETRTFLTTINRRLSDVNWFADSSRFAAVSDELRYASPVLSQLAIFDRDGEQLDIVFSTTSVPTAALSPDNRWLAFVGDESGRMDANRLYLADVDRQTIHDLCFDMIAIFSEMGIAASNRLVWSPDSTQLGFLYDRYPVLLTVDGFDMEILRYETDALLGWYPIATTN